MNREPIVYLIDDDELYRYGLRQMFERENIKVIDFSSAIDFLNYPARQGPACVIVDLIMPEMDGLDLLTAFKQGLVHVPVIVISAYGDISSVVRCMQLGAQNFLQKPVNHKELLGYVQQALSEEQQYRANYGNLQLIAERMKTLTRREYEVLRMIIGGMANKAIAWELGSSVRTIETHRANLMHKLAVRTVADLVRLTLPLRSEFSGQQESRESKQSSPIRNLSDSIQPLSPPAPEKRRYPTRFTSL